MFCLCLCLCPVLAARLFLPEEGCVGLRPPGSADGERQVNPSLQVSNQKRVGCFHQPVSCNSCVRRWSRLRGAVLLMQQLPLLIEKGGLVCGSVTRSPSEMVSLFGKSLGLWFDSVRLVAGLSFSYRGGLVLPDREQLLRAPLSTVTELCCLIWQAAELSYPLPSSDSSAQTFMSSWWKHGTVLLFSCTNEAMLGLFLIHFMCFMCSPSAWHPCFMENQVKKRSPLQNLAPRTLRQKIWWVLEPVVFVG